MKSAADLARDKHDKAVGNLARTYDAMHAQLRAEVSSYTAIWDRIGRAVLARASSDTVSA